jgi:DNA-3-methyladenine glycosylase II
MTLAQELKKAQAHLDKNDKVLSPVIKLSGSLSLTPHADHYGELVSSIVGQQLSAKAGATIWRRVLALFNDKMPTPEQLLKVDAEKIRAAGVSYPKIGYMKDLAAHIVDGRLDMAHISTLSNDELIEQLTAVKGIGQWSAQMFMIFGLGRLDILPVGDLGIRKAAMNLYGLGQLPDPLTLQKLSAKNHWAPYKSVAALYLWKSLDSPAEAHRHEALA